MKKFLTLLLAAVLVLSLPACGGGTPEEEAKDATVTDDELKTVTANIAGAEEAAGSLASLLLDNWTTYADVMIHYYDKETYESGNFFGDGDFERAHELRDSATAALSEAKAAMGTERTGEFYDAVKTYYLAVNDYISLLSKFPDGYSKMTYANAISDCRSACQSAYGEVSFYIE